MTIELKTIGFGGDIEDSDGAWKSSMIEKDGINVGSVSVKTWADGSALIERIDIDENFRNEGIGSTVIKTIAEAHDACYIVADNANAARLYDRLGCLVNEASDWNYLNDGFGVYRIY